MTETEQKKTKTTQCKHNTTKTNQTNNTKAKSSKMKQKQKQNGHGTKQNYIILEQQQWRGETMLRVCVHLLPSFSTTTTKNNPCYHRTI
jgi:hypothetical protein